MLKILFNKIGNYESKILLLCKHIFVIFFLFLVIKVASLIVKELNIKDLIKIIIILLSLPLGYLLGIYVWRLFYKVECNICGWQGIKFNSLDVGYGRKKENILCPSCQSQPRQRLVFSYLNKLKIKDKNKILHISPEISLQKFLQSFKNSDYLSIDLDPKMAMRSENLENTTFSDNYFDLIICIHVLEHVEDDKKAMLEIFRILKKGGLALISVPIDIHRKETYEDKNIKSPEDRTRHFWYRDHLRLYGLDFGKKLENFGFKVETCYAKDYYKKNYIKTHALQEGPIYFCYK